MSDLLNELSKKAARVKNIETGAFVTLSLGDLIYDILRVDPRVAEGIDFSRKESFSNVLSLSNFVNEDIKNRSPESLESLKDLYKGYSFERIVAHDIQKNGGEVEFPEKSNQPGWDIKVNGEEYQVKIQDGGIELIEKHFVKYPDIKVITNSESAQLFYEKYPEYSNMVIDSGFTHDQTQKTVDDSVEALIEISDDSNLFGSAIPEILGIVSIISIWKNSKNYLAGEIDFETTLKNVAIESAGRFGGAGIGAKIGSFLGPLGALAGGALGYFVGGSMANSYKIQNYCKKELKEIDERLNDYIFKCYSLMENKSQISGKKEKILKKILNSKGKKGIEFYNYFIDRKKIEDNKLTIAISKFEKYLKTLKKTKEQKDLSPLEKFKYLAKKFDTSDESSFIEFVEEAFKISKRAGVQPSFVSKELDKLREATMNFSLALKKQGIS